MFNTGEFWCNYMADIKFGKSFVARLLAVSLIGEATWCGFHLYKRSEIGRIKGYLDDFLTEDNYVDLSKVSTSYDIRSFTSKTCNTISNYEYY